MSVYSVLTGKYTTDICTIRSGLYLAQRLNTSLVGILALPAAETIVPMISVYEVVGQQPIMNMEEVTKAQVELANRSKKSFEDVLAEKNSNVPSQHMVEYGAPRRILTNAAVLSDAMVFPKEALDSSSLLNAEFDFLLMRARLPLIVSAETPMNDGPVVIGWDGSATAARSVRLHIPVLQAIGKAVIAHWPDEEERQETACLATPQMLAEKLKEFNMQVDVTIMEGAEVADGLMDLAEDCSASMILTGAYGHSRIEERIFGGVTKELFVGASEQALAVVH